MIFIIAAELFQWDVATHFALSLRSNVKEEFHRSIADRWYPPLRLDRATAHAVRRPMFPLFEIRHHRCSMVTMVRSLLHLYDNQMD